MAKWLEYMTLGFFGVIAIAIVYVKAGKNTSQTGGQQTAAIITAGGNGLSNVASALEGN